MHAWACIKWSVFFRLVSGGASVALEELKPPERSQSSRDEGRDRASKSSWAFNTKNGNRRRPVQCVLPMRRRKKLVLRRVALVSLKAGEWSFCSPVLHGLSWDRFLWGIIISREIVSKCWPRGRAFSKVKDVGHVLYLDGGTQWPAESVFTFLETFPLTADFFRVRFLKKIVGKSSFKDLRISIS